MSDDAEPPGKRMCDCEFDPGTRQCKMCGKSSNELAADSTEAGEMISKIADKIDTVDDNCKDDALDPECDRNEDDPKDDAHDPEHDCSEDDREIKDDSDDHENNEAVADCKDAVNEGAKDDAREDDDEAATSKTKEIPEPEKEDVERERCEEAHQDDDDDECEDFFNKREIMMMITEPHDAMGGKAHEEKGNKDATLNKGGKGCNDEKGNRVTTSLGEEDGSVTSECRPQSELSEKADHDIADSSITTTTSSDSGILLHDGVATSNETMESEVGDSVASSEYDSDRSILKHKLTEFESRDGALVDHVSMLTKVRSPKRRKLMPLTSQCFEPFDKGWRRELVLRATQDETKKRSADVYYYSPNREKLRSGREIEDYLKKHPEQNLRPECFVFSKRAIHEPPFETVRLAKPCRSRPDAAKTSTQSNGTMKKQPSHAVLLKDSRLVTNMAKKRTKKLGLSKRLTQMINSRWPRQKIRRWKEYVEEKTCSLNCPGQVGVLPSLHCRVCLCLFHPSCIGYKDESQPFTCRKCVSEGRDTEQHHAPLGGVVSPRKLNEPKVCLTVSSSPLRPTLPKLTARPPVLCQILSDGVSLKPPPLKKAPVAKPTERCDSISAPVKAASTWMPPCGIPAPRHPPPLRLGTPVQSQHNVRAAVRPPPPLVARPLTLRAVSSSISPAVPPPRAKVNSLPCLRPTIPRGSLLVPSSSSKPNAKLPGSMEGTVKTMKFVLKTNVGETVEVVVPFVTPTGDSGPPQPEYIVVNKQGQSTGLMVRLGQRVVQLPILSQTTRSTSNHKPFPVAKPKHPPEMIVIDDDCGKSKPSEENVKETVTPPPTNMVVPDRQVSNPSPMRTEPPTSGKDASSVMRTDPAASRAVAKRPRTTAGNINPVKCSIQWLHGGVTALTKIFEYLHQGDLSRASRVCRTWNLVTSQPHLWTSVHLDGVLVYDWEGLVRKMISQRSYRLDMRKMLTFEDKNRTWHGFAAVLEDLRHLTRLDFGPAPVSILHTVANTLNNLEVLTAEWVTDICRDKQTPISSCRLDVGKFGQLTTLHVLRLRGVHGIQLLGSATNRCLSDLERLHRLTHLSLTSLKEVPAAELGFVKSLKNLTVLELGECYDWTYRMYENIQTLQRLKKLRLECSKVKGNFALCHALTQLTELQHVELYHFHLDETILKTFGKMLALEWLSLWPDHKLQLQSSAVNTVVLQNIRKCVHLKAFVWGVMTVESPPADKDDNGNVKPSDVDIIDLSDDEGNAQAKLSPEIPDDRECIPFVLTELTSEDENQSPLEMLSLVQLQCRFSKLLPKTVRVIHPAQVEDAWELSHVSGGISF